MFANSCSFSNSLNRWWPSSRNNNQKENRRKAELGGVRNPEGRKRGIPDDPTSPQSGVGTPTPTKKARVTPSPQTSTSFANPKGHRWHQNCSLERLLLEANAGERIELFCINGSIVTGILDDTVIKGVMTIRSTTSPRNTPPPAARYDSGRSTECQSAGYWCTSFPAASRKKRPAGKGWESVVAVCLLDPLISLADANAIKHRHRKQTIQVERLWVRMKQVQGFTFPNVTNPRASVLTYIKNKAWQEGAQ